MTLLVAGLSLSLSMLLGVFFIDLGAASTARARAQAAADATALAAVAEVSPYGTGRQEAIARAYAEHNGGRLVECRCVVGSTAVQVSVAVDGVEATARATFDPAMLSPGSFAFDGRGLHARLAAAVERLIEATRASVYVSSGYRSPVEQAKLWSEAVRRYGSPEAADDWVAPPGSSMHERGLAVDLVGDIPFAARMIETLGLPMYRPLSNEPWHFELAGSRS
ncbi:MAG: D-alanyl-D-alanine carboxypeptidase family protein [Actinomycetota bacterium]